MMLQSCVSFSITDIAKSLVSLVFNWCFIKLLFQVVCNKTRMCKDKPKMELLLICDRFMLSTKKIRTCFRISCDSSRGKSLRYSSTESGSVRKLISCLDNFFLASTFKVQFVQQQFFCCFVEYMWQAASPNQGISFNTPPYIFRWYIIMRILKSMR